MTAGTGKAKIPEFSLGWQIVGRNGECDGDDRQGENRGILSTPVYLVLFITMNSPQRVNLPNPSTAKPVPRKPTPPTKQPEKKLSRLERLRQQQEAIATQIRQELAREAQHQRKLDTRRKVLVGAAVLNQVSQGKLTQEWLMQLLDEELTRECDRKIFELPEGGTASKDQVVLEQQIADVGAAHKVPSWLNSVDDGRVTDPGL